MASAAAGAGAGEVSVRMPTASADPPAAAAGGEEVQRRESAGANATNPEKKLNRFVRFVAFGEWAGNAFGALAFVWATGVLLGGFCSSLNREDFWFATVMIFIEAFRIFSRGYRLDQQALFGTTRALRWISSSFARMLGRPQEGNQVMLVMGLWIILLGELPSFVALMGIPKVALLILMSRRPRRPGRCQMRAVLIASLLAAAYQLNVSLYVDSSLYTLPMPLWLAAILPCMIELVAALLLNLRPCRLANITSTPGGRKLLYLGKVISVVWSASDLVRAIMPQPESQPVVAAQIICSNFSTPFTVVVLSLGSLQSPADSLFGRWIDVVMHILFLWVLVVFPPITYIFLYFSSWDQTPFLAVCLSFLISLLFLLICNLQIPAAVVQITLSSLRLGRLLAHIDYNPLPQGSSPNMVPAIAVFYVLAQCQGVLYIMASVLALFSSLPRRSLIRRSNLGGQLGAKAIDLYYRRTYATRMEIGVFAAGRATSFDNFAVKSLSSDSRELQVAGVCVLDNILQRRDCSSKDLVLRVTSSTTAVSTLIGMLAWTAVEDSYLIRLFAARVTIELADSLRIDGVPGMVKLVSSLLTENAVPNQQLGHHGSSSQAAYANRGNEAGRQPTTNVRPAHGSNGGCSWVYRSWQRVKKMWSVPEDPTSSHQDTLPVLGMVILEKLACDLDNCREIFKATNLISKTIELISYTTDSESSHNVEQQNALVCSSLKFLRRLAITGGKIGVALRQELWSHPLLLNNLVGVLEDTRSDSRLWKPAMDIIAKLALDEIAGKQIGGTQVITGKLMHAFLARCGPANVNDDRSLPMAAGEALANLAMWGTANCSAILEEPGYEIIMDLKSMLSEDAYRYVAANLLQDLCAHCRVKLMNLPDASQHLSSALTTVMEHIEAAEGKQLESLIGLASEIADIMEEAFVRKLESQTNNGAELVQKLVATLNSANRKPNPEYPRMRRFVVKIVIAIFGSCHGTVGKMKEERVIEGLMEALTKIERTISEVEKYRVFYGNRGVVLESGELMHVLVGRAKALIRPATQPAEGRR